MIRRLCLVAAVLPVAVACSSSDSSGETAASETSVNTTEESGDVTTPPVATDDAAVASTTPSTSSTPASSSATTVPPATTTPTTVPTTVTYPSAADELGLAPMVQLTPIDGGGSRPLLEWEPVDGAALYHVFVLAPSGAVYWGWSTADTSVPVGGLPRLDEVAFGPAVSPGMTWSVSAADEGGHIIALSPQRPIDP